jgi:5-methylcytosine-specific restriction protein A
MPRRKLRPCSHHSCHELTRETYCSKHAVVKVEQRKDANKFYNNHVRDKDRAAFYKTKQWTKLRLYILQRDNYLCAHCLKENKITAAKIVDHICPLEVDMAKGLDPDNLQVLCQAHHNRKTNEDKKRYGL